MSWLRPSIMKQRWPLSSDASIDLILSTEVSGLPEIDGFYVRQYADSIPIALLPNVSIKPIALLHAREAAGTVAVHEGYGTGSIVQLDFSTTSASPTTSTIAIPLLSTAPTVPFLHWKINSPAGDSLPLARVHSADSTVIQTSLSNATTPHVFAFTPNQMHHRLRITSQEPVHIFSGGSRRSYTILLGVDATETPPIILDLTYDDGTLTIHKPSAIPIEAEFTILFSPTSLDHMAGGYRLSRTSVSDTIIGMSQKTPIPIIHWLTCAPIDPVSRIVSRNPLGPLKLSLPLLTYLSDDDSGFLFHQDDRRSLEHARYLIFVGEASISWIHRLIQTRNFTSLKIISTEASYVDSLISSLSPGRPTIDMNPYIPYHTKIGETDILVILCPSMSHTGGILENFIRLHPELPTPNLFEGDHSSYLLPSLPFCSDISIGLISLIGNMNRGRMPEEDGESVVGNDVYSDDSLWLTEWNLPKTPSRDTLIFELNVRIASECLAMTAYSDLFDDKINENVNATGVESTFRNRISALFRQWYHWPDLSRKERRSLQVDAHECVISADIGRTQVIRLLTAAAYRAVTRQEDFAYLLEMPNSSTAFANLTFVLISSSALTVYDTPFYALYAGRFSGSKPSGIYFNVYDEVDIRKSISIVSRIRHLLHHYPLGESGKDELFSLRTSLIHDVNSYITDSGYGLLAIPGSDIVTAFTDVALEWLPFRGTILGLERPVCRIPCSVSPFIAVTRLAASILRTNDVERVPRLGLLYNPVESDATTQWSAQVAAEIRDRTRQVLGIPVIFPTEVSHDKSQILNDIVTCSVVIFVGHASASDHWAGLDLGESYLTVSDVRALNWSGIVVFLIGCETAAIDTVDGDIAGALISGGARAVIGSSGILRVDVADIFFVDIINLSVSGHTLDWAFLLAKRRAFLYEVLSTRLSKAEARTEVQRLGLPGGGQRFLTMAAILESFGLTWDDAMREAPYSLGLTLMSGASVHLI